MLEKIKEYFETEYKDTVNSIGAHYRWIEPSKIISQTLDRCFGVAMFAQTIGVKYEDIAILYNEYKEKLEKLLTEL